MSSIKLTFISLILILVSDTKADDFKKKLICEEKLNYIDAVVEFKDYRYFLIDDNVFEYDLDFNFRRRGVVFFDVDDFDVMDGSEGQKIVFGTYLSGLYIPKIDCKKASQDIQHNCTETVDFTLSNSLVVVTYDLLTNKYLVFSKKYNFGDDFYQTLNFSSNPDPEQTDPNPDSEQTGPNPDSEQTGPNPDSEQTGPNPDSEQTDPNPDSEQTGPNPDSEQTDPNPDSEQTGPNPDSDPYPDPEQTDEKPSKYCTKYDICGPYSTPGRTKPRVWLLKNLEQNKRHKFLPLFYDSTKMELLVILNKEYEMFGENPSLIREHARLYSKSLQYEDPGWGWKEWPLSDEYTYTAFLKIKEEVYLIAEPFQERRNAKRGPSFLLPFDLNKKQVTEKTKKNALELFGCSFDGNDPNPYMIIGILLVILVLIICLWIYACYWFYAKEPKTAYNSNRTENG